MRHRLVVLGVYVTTSFYFLCCRAINPACDCVVYQSYGLNAGRFTSPNFPDAYPPSINCILYSFIGDATEIIELTFVEFNLKMPDDSGRCGDYLRVYQNLERPEVNEYNQHDLEFCGGYSSIQNTVYSSGRSLVLEFHADLRKGKSGNFTGFNGIYQFLDKRNYITTGIKVLGKQCTYDFHSNDTHRQGQFFSPFYPQNYKPLSTCHYRFHAKRGERVKIEFTNIQLHHIDASCRDSPDVIVVHDGPDEEAPVIGQFCGMHNGEEFTSTGPNLFVKFSCDDRDQRQGFAAKYKFNKSTKDPKSVNNHSADESGVPDTGPTQFPAFHNDLGYIPHYVGTPNGFEFSCNEDIDSRTYRNGTISSPFHPDAYPADITCRYIFTGVGRERIQLRFLHLDLHFPSGDPSAPIDCDGSDSVSVYIIINGKTNEIDTWCGRKLPPMLMSSQPKMIVEFRSYHSSASVTGFKAQYSFVTNFGIKEGEQDNRGTCVFNYRSTQKTSGEIWSPNYNGLYPRNTECHYLFYGRSNEQVQIIFVDFDVDGISPRCEESTKSDYVSFSNFADTEDRKMTRLCGQPPNDKREIWSDGPFFRVIFKSNDIYDSTGFHAYYQFKSPGDSSAGRFSTSSKSGDVKYPIGPRDVKEVSQSKDKSTSPGSGCAPCLMTSPWCLCLLIWMSAVFANEVFPSFHCHLTGIHLGMFH